MEKLNEDMAFMQNIEDKQLGQSSSKVVFLILYTYFFFDYFLISSKIIENVQTRLYKDFVPTLQYGE